MTDSTQHTAIDPKIAARGAVWPCLVFRDARATAEFLVEAFGFEISALYARPDDPAIIEHGELRWPYGGGVMFGSEHAGNDPSCSRAPGLSVVHLVCPDPDGLYQRAKATGAEIVRELYDADYGSRGFGARDPEGNNWSFGTYYWAD